MDGIDLMAREIGLQMLEEKATGHNTTCCETDNMLLYAVVVLLLCGLCGAAGFIIGHVIK